MPHTNQAIAKKPSEAARSFHTSCPIPRLWCGVPQPRPMPSTWDIAQIELNAYVQQQADEVPPEIEVDSLLSAENPTYRVWFGCRGRF